MDKQVVIAVVGAGWWATYTHIPALQQHGAVAEIVLCDNNPDRLGAAAEAYHINKTYTDLATMLRQEDVAGAVIATSHASHFALAKASLESGLHVMIEKPMTLYARDAKALIDLAHAQGREIIMGYPYHFTAHVRRAREVIHSGELGAIQLVNCFMASNILELLRGNDGSERQPGIFPVHGPGNVYAQPHLSGGGQGHLQITHSAGLMFYVTGLAARRVHALMQKHDLPLDLVDAMLVEFATPVAHPAIGVVSGTGNQASREGGLVDLQVYCEHGSVDMNVSTGVVNIYRRNAAPEVIHAAADDHYPRFATAQNLVDVCAGLAANGSPVKPGWRAVELLDAAYHSAAEDGRRVEVADLYQ